MFHAHLKKCGSAYSVIECTDVYEIQLIIGLLKSCFLLTFHQVILCAYESGMLKSPTVLAELSISLFNVVCLCYMYSRTLFKCKHVRNCDIC